VAAAKGYQLILTMPETMSLERRTLLAMLGAKLELTPGAKGMKGAIARAEEMSRRRRMPGCRSSSTTRPIPEIHRKTTAEEIWADTDGKVDILIAAVGTGGTLTGCSEVIKPRRPGFKAIAVEPADSPVISQTMAGEAVVPGPHKIQGTGAGFVPNNLHIACVDECIKVTNDEAFAMAERIAKEEGILVGISTGANVATAIKVASRRKTRANSSSRSPAPPGNGPSAPRWPRRRASRWKAEWAFRRLTQPHSSPTCPFLPPSVRWPNHPPNLNHHIPQLTIRSRRLWDLLPPKSSLKSTNCSSSGESSRIVLGVSGAIWFSGTREAASDRDGSGLLQSDFSERAQRTHFQESGFGRRRQCTVAQSRTP